MALDRQNNKTKVYNIMHMQPISGKLCGIWRKKYMVYGEKLYDMEEKFYRFMEENYMGLWGKIIWDYGEKLCGIWRKNYIGLWRKIISVYGGKLYRFMEENYM